MGGNIIEIEGLKPYYEGIEEGIKQGVEQGRMLERKEMLSLPVSQGLISERQAIELERQISVKQK